MNEEIRPTPPYVGDVTRFLPPNYQDNTIYQQALAARKAEAIFKRPARGFDKYSMYDGSHLLEDVVAAGLKLQVDSVYEVGGRPQVPVLRAVLVNPTTIKIITQDNKTIEVSIREYRFKESAYANYAMPQNAQWSIFAQTDDWGLYLNMTLLPPDAEGTHIVAPYANDPSDSSGTI